MFTTSGYPYSGGDQLPAADVDDIVEELQNLTNYKSFTAGEALAANDSLYLQAEGNPTFTGSQSGFFAINGDGSTVSHTESFTMPSGDNRYLVVSISAYNVQYDISITYAGVAMTRLYTSPGSNREAFIFVLPAPAVGTNDLVISVRGANEQRVTFGIWAGKNIKQTTDIDYAVTSTSGTTHSVSKDFENDGSLIYSFMAVLSESDTLVFSSDTNTSNKRIAFADAYDTALSPSHGQAVFDDSPIDRAQASVTSTITSDVNVDSAKYFVLELPAINPTIKVYKTQATDTFEVNRFTGFAESAVSAGAAIETAIFGILGGFTDLVPGAFYYLSDTAGEISLTAGSNSKVVGKAVSTTELLIINNAE